MFCIERCFLTTLALLTVVGSNGVFEPGYWADRELSENL